MSPALGQRPRGLSYGPLTAGQGSWCPPERGRERTYRTEAAALTHQTSTIGRADQPVYKAGGHQVREHTAGTGLWGHLGGWLHPVFLLRILTEGVRWDQGLPGGLDAFAAGDSGRTPRSEQGPRGPARRKGPTFYHRHHFSSSLGTFGGNGSDKFGCVTPPGVSCCITKLSV